MDLAFCYEKIHTATHSLLDLISPSKCALCEKRGTSLCGDCENILEKNKKDIVPYFIYAHYNYKDKKVKRLILKAKYKNNTPLARGLGGYAKSHIVDILKDTHVLDYVLVPIPISSSRLAERGFNQTQHICMGIDETKIKNILIRSKNTTKLKNISSIDKRSEEVAGSMSVDEKLLDESYKNRTVILVDDVTTTGATFYEARRALTASGFKKENIVGFAIAH